MGSKKDGSEKKRPTKPGHTAFSTAVIIWKARATYISWPLYKVNEVQKCLQEEEKQIDGDEEQLVQPISYSDFFVGLDGINDLHLDTTRRVW